MTGGGGDARVLTEMKKISIILSLVFIVSCTRFDVVSDPYWMVISPSVKLPVLKYGYRMRYRIVSGSYTLNKLRKIIIADHPDILLLSPLLSPMGKKLGKEFPAVHIYYFSFSPEEGEGSPADRIIALYGYSRIPFSRAEKLMKKLIYFIPKKENMKDYSDINLMDIE